MLCQQLLRETFHNLHSYQPLPRASELWLRPMTSSCGQHVLTAMSNDGLHFEVAHRSVSEICSELSQQTPLGRVWLLGPPCLLQQNLRRSPADAWCTRQLFLLQHTSSSSSPSTRLLHHSWSPDSRQYPLQDLQDLEGVQQLALLSATKGFGGSFNEALCNPTTAAYQGSVVRPEKLPSTLPSREQLHAP